MLELVLQRKFEAGHRLIEGKNRDTICSQPHGHSWHIKAYFSALEERGLDLKENTLILFSKLKAKWFTWIDQHLDHSFMFNEADPLLEFMLSDHPKGRHLVTPGDPTTEILAVLFKCKLIAFLKNDKFPMTCHKLTLSESATNGVICTDDHRLHLPTVTASGQLPWWFKNDFSMR